MWGGVVGSIPGQGIKIPHALRHGQKNFLNQINKIKLKKRRRYCFYPNCKYKDIRVQTRWICYRDFQLVSDGSGFASRVSLSWGSSHRKAVNLNSFQKCQKGFSNALQARSLDVNPWRFKAVISGSCCSCPSWDLGRRLGEKGQLAGPFKLSQQGMRSPGGPWSWSPQTFPSVFAVLPSPSVFFAGDGAGQSPKGCLAKSSDMGQFLVTFFFNNFILFLNFT